MTLATTPPLFDYVENGVTLVHAIPFQFKASADIVCSRIAAAVETMLTLGVDYTVTGGAGATGSVTKMNGGINGQTFRIKRLTARAQATDYTPGDAFPAETHEAALDRAMAVDQEQDVRLADVENRAVHVPVGESAPTLPPRTARAGRFLAFDAGGDAVAASGTGNDPNLRTDLAAASGAALVAVQGHAPAIVRSVQQILDEGLSLRKDFGALGDGTDQTVKVQSGLDAVIETGGAALRCPGGEYALTGGLTFDISAEASRFAKRLRIIGDGPAITNFKFLGVAGTLLDYIGNVASAESYLAITGIRLSGDNTIGSRGLYLTAAALATFDRIVVEGFDQNVEFLNVDQSSISNSTIRWGRKGLKTNVGTETAANSLVLQNVAIGNNLINGLDLSDLNLFTMIGGSVQYNGATGAGATNFGCKLSNPGTSYGPIKFEGVCFEGNGGQADLWVDSTTAIAAINVDSCGFMRSTAGNYATNNIRLDGTQVTRMKLTTTGFRTANAYVPDAGRPNLAINNTAAVVHSDGTNLFGSAVEAPSWYASRWPIILNSGIVHICSGQIAQAFAWDPASLAAGATATTTFAMPGVELGDGVIASFSTATGVQLLHAEVISTGNVGVRLNNDTGGALDENGIVLIRVFKL